MRCKGFKQGTGCKKVSRNPYAKNWLKWQLCHECAVILHAIEYQGVPKRGTGGTYLKDPQVESMIVQ